MDGITAGYMDPGWPQMGSAERMLEKVELIYPPLLLLVCIVAGGIHGVLTSRSEEELDASSQLGPGGKPLPMSKKKKEKGHDPESDKLFSRTIKSALFYLTLAVVVTFAADILAIILHFLESRGMNLRWYAGDARIVYVFGSAFFYLYILITFFDWRDSPNAVHFVVWFLGLLGEFAILILLTLSKTDARDSVRDMHQSSRRDLAGLSKWDLTDLVIAVIRLVLFIGLVAIYAPVAARRYLKERRLREEEASRARRLAAFEETPLLQRDLNGINYRSRECDEQSTASSETDCQSHGTDGYQSSRSKDEEEMGFYRPEKLPHKTWYEYCRGYKLFFQYLWPSKSPRLQGVVFVCFVLVLCQRVVNVLVPYQLGVLTDSLQLQEGFRQMPWGQLLLLIVFKLLQGTGGLLGCLRDIMWIGVSQHTYRALTTAAFEHVHSLSLEFHLSKRTGEVLSALNKGASINSFLEQITFQVGPMLLDLVLAIFFFYAQFGPIYALIVSVVSFYYLYLTVRMAATRADQRRDMVNADREEEAIKNDSITSYETVKYFNAEPSEFRRYRAAIKKFQVAEAQVTWGLTAMNLAQSFIFVFGIFAAMTVCAFEVSEGTRTVGDFVSLITYLAQLQGPLTFLGVFYRTVQQAMIAGERLLELFKIRPTVVDKPGVRPLNKCEGYIRWNNVHFAYDERRPALQNLSFECKPGTTTAFVGESGGGKSTVFRLMYRYYNSSSGSIEIDGHDVKHLTIDSVRRYIGVVPQDTILFNESLMYNLRYANPKATDQEVHDACRLAAIHDRIMGFPDGYETNVGDRGVRLSGGEKQRVAIARAILKNPKIIMLDEATSALDGETEQRIQGKLISGNLGAGRTLLIIAHRLSTITHADQIVVLHAGGIAEKGTHEELLAYGGRYASMWEKHCRAELAAEEARVATGKAQELLRQAKLLPKGSYSKSDPGSPSDTEEVPALA